MPNYIKQFCNKTKELVKDQSGQGLVEYALILVLIAIVVIAAVKGIGTQTSTVFSNVTSSLK